MPTTQGQIDIINQALSLLGVEPVESIADGLQSDNNAVVQAFIHWLPSLDVLGRAAAWQCITKAAKLEQVAQDPLDPGTPAPASTPWAPLTAYPIPGTYVTFGSPAYLYVSLIAHVSTANFTNDLTAGFWQQTDIYNANPFAGTGANYASSWAYKYNLPEDCLLVTRYNEITDYRELFEIMGGALYSDDAQVVIKYTWPDPDTTRYDAMFVECLVYKLAARMATKLRQDDTNVSMGMEKLYLSALGRARAKNGNEKTSRRFNPVANSRWVGSRRWSTNG